MTQKRGRKSAADLKVLSPVMKNGGIRFVQTEVVEMSLVTRTLGNILSIISTVIAVAGMIVTLSIWGARQDQRMLQSERRIEQNAANITATEVRLRSIEQSTARQDERLLLILDNVREIKESLKAK